LGVAPFEILDLGQGLEAPSAAFDGEAGGALAVSSVHVGIIRDPWAAAKRTIGCITSIGTFFQLGASDHRGRRLVQEHLLETEAEVFADVALGLG
jgi:hypothetical protein